MPFLVDQDLGEEEFKDQGQDGLTLLINQWNWQRVCGFCFCIKSTFYGRVTKQPTKQKDLVNLSWPASYILLLA
jgi:hypothetical protein